jgi:predicted NBD/HSP70 family sugar kinase
VLLTLNPEMGWVLGVSLRPGLATLVLLDAAGGRIDSTQASLQGEIETFPAQIHQALKHWLRKRGQPSGKLIGMGVGVPGVVDADAGVVLRSIPLRAVNVPLQKLLSDEFGVTVVVDHDACFGAGAEATDGAAADVSHFVYFSINTVASAEGLRVGAFGSALYLHGKIYRGAFYGAGELSGPLEPQAAVLSDTDVNALSDPQGSMPPALIELADRIGKALGPIVNLIDVQMVLLAGIARISNRRFIAAVQLAVTDQLVAIPGRAVRVVRSAWGPEAAARGAAVAAFDAIVAEGKLFSDTDERKIIRSAKEAALEQ